MASYSRLLLSASTNGRPIPVAATATPGTPIHVCVDGVSAFDEVFLWASNVTNTAAKLTIEWGGAGNPSDHVVHQYTVPGNSAPIPIIAGQTLNGGVTVAAFSDTVDAINITGFVNRIQ